MKEGISQKLEKNAFLLIGIALAAALFVYTGSAVAAILALVLVALVKYTSESNPKFVVKVHEKKWLYYAIALFIVLAFLTKPQTWLSESFALVAATCAFLLLLVESIVNAELKPKAGGWGKELNEVGIAIVTALVIWFALSFILQTSSPLDAVVSCSMLPGMERGDIVVLQGGAANAPLVNVTKEEWDALSASGAFHKVCGICVEAAGQRPCLLDAVKKAEVGANETRLFECGWCKRRKDSGAVEQVACVTGLDLGGKRFALSTTNDVVVYEPLPTDLFARSGSIIHRVQAVVNAGGKVYYFTKGDNNPQFDVQAIEPATGVTNEPAQASRTKGKVIVRLPYLGYFKLLLSGMLATPSGCEYVMQ